MLAEPITMVVMGAATTIGAIVRLDVVKVWVVFFLCLLFSAAGVFISFVLLGSTFDNNKLWLVGILIAIVMLGIKYGAKHANAQSRREFTPVDLIQYTSQGFLWPSAWPSLATALGVSPIAPPPIRARSLMRSSFWDSPYSAAW